MTMVQEEIMSVLAAASVAADTTGTVFNQLLLSIQALIGAVPHGVQTFYAAGSGFTFTVPAGVMTIDVELWGGGSGSWGSSTTAAGGGGSGGGYSKKRISGLTPGAVIPMVIGAAGTAGTNIGPAAPGAGGLSSFGTGPYHQAAGGIVESAGGRGLQPIAWQPRRGGFGRRHQPYRQRRTFRDDHAGRSGRFRSHVWWKHQFRHHWPGRLWTGRRRVGRWQHIIDGLRRCCRRRRRLRGEVVTMWGSLRGVPVVVDPVWLDPKLPAAITPYRFCISPLDALVLTGLTLSAAPSGTGELVITALGYGAGTWRFKAAGGQPTRCYTLLLSVSRSDGMVSEYLLNLRVGFVLTTDQAQVAPVAGFGTAVSWP